MMGPDEHLGLDSTEHPLHREDMETLALSDGPFDGPHPLSSVSVPVPAASGGDALLSFYPPSVLFPSTPSSSFLGPPSYADAVFRPSDGRSDDPDFTSIAVSDPQKEQDIAGSSLVPGGSTYVTYLITSRRRAAGIGPSPEFTVRRRFRDFVTLADRLAESHRGLFIPPRPDKSVVEGQVMQKQDFVHQRQTALEKYLIRLSEHPVIGRSNELRAFLQDPGRLPLPATAEPKQLFRERDVARPAKGGRDLLRVFKELRQSMSNEWGGARPLVVEEDKDFLEKKERIRDLEQQLSTASQQAEALVKAQQDIGETMGELGLAFIKLAKFETKEATHNSQRVRAAEMKRLATAAVKASRFYRESNAQTVKHLDTLHEYLGLMLAINSAFSDRSSALLTVQTLLSDLSSLHTKVEKFEAASSRSFGGDKSRSHKIEELKETIRITEDAKSCAFSEYERIKENNKNELVRLDRERHDDFLGMLKGFVINQAYRSSFYTSGTPGKAPMSAVCIAAGVLQLFFAYRLPLLPIN